MSLPWGPWWPGVPFRRLDGIVPIVCVGVSFVALGLTVPSYGNAFVPYQITAAGAFAIITGLFLRWRRWARALSGAFIAAAAIERLAVLLLADNVQGPRGAAILTWAYIAALTFYAWPYILPYPKITDDQELR